MKKTKLKLDCFIEYILSIEKYLTPHRIKFCNQFLKLYPKCEKVYLDRGQAYEYIKKYVFAIKDYTKALRIKPDAYTYQRRAETYIVLRQYKKAMEDLNKVIQLQQKTRGRNMDGGLFSKGSLLSKRAECYIGLKIFNCAIKDLKRAIRSSERKDLYYARIAELYSSSKDKKTRDGKKAIDYANKAIASLNEFRKKKNLPKQESSYHLSVLAATYAQLGKFNDAIRTQKKAIALLRHVNELKKYKNRLNLYKQRLPFIEK